jgi:SAM-dependent methyltransferase
VKAEFAEQLRCPVCRRDHVLCLEIDSSDEREVREGRLRCAVCGSEFAVHRGVPELLHQPPEHVRIEAAGLERFAEQMRAEGWDRERVRRLPHLENGYWYVQWRSLFQLLQGIGFRAGETIVDVGSNTCWAASRFARDGLRSIALDIATTELQGLYTAEYFIDDGEVFFERVLGSMEAMPLASASVDYVFCCEVLHHNDPEGLRRTFAEAFRVLRPGGRLLMVNETLRTLHDPHGVHVDHVAQFDGYEHAYWAWRYRWEAIRSGFYTEVMEPHYMPFFGDDELPNPPQGGPVAALGHRAAVLLQRRGLARRAYLAWLNHIRGGVSMNMVATKPYRFVGRDEGVMPASRIARMAAAGMLMQVARALGRPTPGRLPRTPQQAEEARRIAERAMAERAAASSYTDS